MNEELQKQILEILKGMRDNANPAFQELVRQYQGVYATYLGINAIFGIILTCLLIWGIKLCKDERIVSNSDGAIYCLPVFSSVFILVDMIVAGINLTQYLYPLGNVLNKIL